MAKGKGDGAGGGIGGGAAVTPAQAAPVAPGAQQGATQAPTAPQAWTAGTAPVEAPQAPQAPQADPGEPTAEEIAALPEVQRRDALPKVAPGEEFPFAHAMAHAAASEAVERFRTAKRLSIGANAQELLERLRQRADEERGRAISQGMAGLVTPPGSQAGASGGT